MIKAVIIDDEPQARIVLKTLLNEYTKGVKIVGEAASAKTGIKLIKEHAVDLVFLDIEMPRMDGFGLLRQFETIDFDVVFTTAYSNYAINAIKFSALDYLLKPIDPDELKVAVERCKQRVNSKKAQAEGIYFLPDDFTNLQHQNSKIALPTTKGFRIVQISDVFYCEAARNYTTFFLMDNQQIVVGRNLKYFNEKLAPFGFFRIHESYLINLSHLKNYEKGRGGQVILSNDAVLDVSRNRKSELLKLMSL